MEDSQYYQALDAQNQIIQGADVEEQLVGRFLGLSFDGRDRRKVIKKLLNICLISGTLSATAGVISLAAMSIQGTTMTWYIVFSVYVFGTISIAVIGSVYGLYPTVSGLSVAFVTMVLLYIIDLSRCIVFYIYVALNSSYSRGMNQAAVIVTASVSMLLFLATLLIRRVYTWNPATFEFIPTAPPVQWAVENQQPEQEQEETGYRTNTEPIQE
eukprot:gb/GECG01004047.1/.p1 GENE.gb/GECG01004047.1/~~gb/GECG01004047.1/.p1  ORF type:complete len:213 (+),score=20.67 gb/GECG01004047.1/:1-639(+)